MDNLSEKEKMIKQMYYNAMDPELIKMRADSEILFQEYNKTSHDETDKRTEIFNKLFGQWGTNLYIRPPFYCDYGFNTFIGKNVYINFNCTILDCAKVTIGDNTLIAPSVEIYTAAHPTDPQRRLEGEEFAKEIVIGNNCWIGGGVIICAGVSIGDNTTIGAGSVVIKDIPSDCIAVGNPCKVIRYLNN
jgi:maltose O-acetyltransferase